MDDKALEKIYQESLDERIIQYLAETEGIPFEEATRIYYSSRMADRIYKGKNDIQYLDYKVLVEMMKDTEAELFVK